MAKTKLSLLARLQTAVKKVKFLLNFNVNRWRLASMIGASSSKRRVSFNDDKPGLRAYVEFDTDSDESVSPAGGLYRTASYPSEDDIDKKADLFIANFYRQLRIERQISLDLKYCRGSSFNNYVSP